MLDKHVPASSTRRRLRSGVAANYIDDFAECLASRGHKARTVFRLLQSFAAWTDWLSLTGRSEKDFVSGYRDCAKHIHSSQHARYSRGPKQDSLRAARLFLTVYD